MIDISQEEFITYLEKYANNEISMMKLVKILETDVRTMNNKIIEMSVDNPDLYYKIITSHPYKQKGRTDIDFEALMIYVIKHGLMIQDAIEIFNISRRTIQRRVNEMQDTNPELYRLFKIHTGKEKGFKKRLDFIESVEKLESRPVVIGEVNEDREKFLLSIESKYNQLVKSGMSKEQAAREMGYSKAYIYKALNELYRLKIEKDVKERKTKEFRDSLSNMSKYETNNNIPSNTTPNDSQQDNNNNGR